MRGHWLCPIYEFFIPVTVSPDNMSVQRLKRFIGNAVHFKTIRPIRIPRVIAKNRELGRLTSGRGSQSQRGFSPHCSVAVTSSSPPPPRANPQRLVSSLSPCQPSCLTFMTHPLCSCLFLLHWIPGLKCASIPLSKFDPSNLATYGQHRLRARFFGGGVVLGSSIAAAMFMQLPLEYD